MKVQIHQAASTKEIFPSLYYSGFRIIPCPTLTSISVLQVGIAPAHANQSYTTWIKAQFNTTWIMACLSKKNIFMTR